MGGSGQPAGIVNFKLVVEKGRIVSFFLQLSNKTTDKDTVSRIEMSILYFNYDYLLFLTSVTLNILL